MLDDFEYPREFADRIYRESLKKQENLRDLVSAVLPEIASGFVFERAELLDREFPLDDWRRRESDLLFRIPYCDGEAESETLICLLVEHQSQPDARMPLRLFLYAVLYWEREWKNWESLPAPREEFRLTPIVPIVFHTGERAWNTSRQLADLLSGPELFKAFAPNWPVCFWDLAERSPRELLNSTHVWLKALAVPRAGGEDTASFSAVLNEAVEQLSALCEQSEIRWYDLLHFMLSWSLRLRPKTERSQIIKTVRLGQRSTRDSQETKQMTQTIDEALIEEGMEKGLEIGLAQGRRETELVTSRAILRDLLEARFGAGALPSPLLLRIEQTEDAATLRAATRQVLTIADPNELVL
jgi:hypothetical protein